MGKRFDCSTPRPKSDGTGSWWLRVGSAWQNDNGQITVYLDSYPIPDKDGVVKIMLFEPRPPSTQPGTPAPRQQNLQQWGKDDIDDEIPF